MVMVSWHLFLSIQVEGKTLEACMCGWATTQTKSHCCFVAIACEGLKVSYKCSPNCFVSFAVL